MRGKPSRLVGLIMTGLVVTVLSLSVTACGKRGNPKPADDKPVTYPKAYPTK